MDTLPESNIAPENRKGDSYWKPPFLGSMLVLGSVTYMVIYHGGKKK